MAKTKKKIYWFERWEFLHIGGMMIVFFSVFTKNAIYLRFLSIALGIFMVSLSMIVMDKQEKYLED